MCSVGIGGDDEVRADDDLHQHRVVRVPEGLAGELCQAIEPGRSAAQMSKSARCAATSASMTNPGSIGQVQVRELHGQAPADADPLQDLRFDVRFALVKEVDVLLHALSFPFTNQNRFRIAPTCALRNASNMWLAPCFR